jgi:nucleoside-diphosphate-sugar epimerase
VDGGILITGAAGFVGSKLLATLRARGRDAEPALLDLADAASVEAAVAARPWDAVVHLAGESHVGKCEADPAKAYRINLGGTCLLLDAVHAHCPRAHFMFASSAQLYAAPAPGVDAVIDETWPVAPRNVYSKTKWRSELAIQDLAAREGLRATVLRFFNHTHRAQSPDFFLPAVYAELVKAPRGEAAEVRVGNLDVWRDIGALSDLVEALICVLDRPPAEAGARVFNVCSGRAKHLRSLADSLAARLGVRAKFTVDPARVRAGEAASVCGSHGRLTAATGWAPRFRTDAELIDSFLAD